MSERMNELLCDRALEGLDPVDTAELEQLLAAFGTPDVDAFDRAAAAIDLAYGVTPGRGLPAELARRIELHAAEVLPRAVSSLPRHGGGPGRGRVATRRVEKPAVLPWLLAAACLALALGAAWRASRTDTLERAQTGLAVEPPALPEPPVDAASSRAALLAAGARRADWQPGADPAAARAKGDIVWSAASQRGFMRLEGLAANDPRVSQYQLWIFDPSQEHPVDGGVFDMPAAGEAIVPIDPKLRVSEATLFAVTVEKPGGVVVSKRERIVLTAKLSG